jgi:cysteinyl-tRNA synthetase
MNLKLYNTRTRKKENFKPLNDKKVGIYSCGPTVYWYQHIGNLRTYVFSDILKRVLIYDDYKVKHVVNITDVGHLTSDSDTGEDKMEESARKEGKSAEEIADYYFEVFEEDLKKLNILEPDVWPKATEHIKEQIELIKKLEKKGYTYETSDGIYFDTSKFKDYGKFANLDVEGLQAGKRIDLGEKKNKTDFALWKFSNPEDKRLQEWKSPWGKGFPGWHIECSAMSSKYLGEKFDIHTGGIDHINVHHTNEIAQSECAFGKKPWVNFWMHGAFLTFKDGKMSKSSGKITKLSDLEGEGFEPLIYRYFCLTTHYRKPLIFSKKNLESAQNAYERLKNIISEFNDDGKVNEKYLKEFEKVINDDLDMPNALQVLWKFVRDGDASGKLETIKKWMKFWDWIC